MIEGRISTWIKAASLLALAALLGACSSPTFQDEPSGEFAESGLYPVRSTGFEEAYARRDAELSSYSTVNIEDLALDNVDITQTTVSGTVRRDWQITPRREANLLDAWAVSMERAFSSYDRSDAGEKVLRITAELTRVRPRRSSGTAITPTGSPIAGSGDSVDISVAFRLYDQASGDLLAVIRDRRTIASLQWTRGEGMDMVNLFNSWSRLLHSRVSGR